jgi:hypothetical protein
LQQITVTVPVSRLHLVAVDGQGAARLKLRPRFELDAQQRVVRKDYPPTFDVPPTMDDLFREAARNHQLERAYHAERTAERAKQREMDYEMRVQIAQAFLGDRTRRALEEPTPTRTYCFLVTDSKRHLRFDVNLDQGPARDVPPEAYRRFKADVRARRAARRQQRFTQLTVHDDKAAFMAEWVAQHGTPEQQARQTAGVWPVEEAVQAITEEAFNELRDRPLYVRDGVARLQAHLRQFPAYADAVVTRADLRVTFSDAVAATAAQWELLQQFKAIVPDADVKLRAHKLALNQNPNAPTLTVCGVLVTRKIGPFVIRREYAAADA